ncbi:tRNA uridine-5-carboxymethylaminomethyl(34) synthesis GTPase MnmE [Ancylomarina sp. 16SWW S1-10-2]|uniref:tRNA uridine-5-carboxymethylaminomethyl(34) synthesis GTPase MnmE n=1 Tax=Ancylomarina sp. 16SWW S1-10-2 TaxID=2499681 RepID=UPI0012AE48B5|nr:tRNA uridine-5-carboxymethylaminomethyl(34) synthesis GTPase MnmE [Ancylomarina sp. 16SWW S1-10-2]MRT92065.1 tRNA uridine-5-carboxymethylaminomethyl(34) synthesis GTPase MnmE [Ancylomarina sp. 16SWW S1-10-2]
MINQSTICAISTAAGHGAIAIIRLSGEQALKICDQVFQAKSKKLLSDQKANTVHFGDLMDGKELVDEVLVSVFKAPHSYTGENSAEIACHGAPYIQQRILQVLLKAGARMAKPGEYTQRAFLNGKMDLSQAEAVADLIASSSASAHKVALQQMRGGFSSEIANLRGRLLHFISMIELELDFGEEDVEFADRTQLQALVTEIETAINKLVNSFELGNAIKNGVPVAIVGNTNVGKSTLLNALLKEEKAIVSDIEGTTRDVIEDTINLGGVTFRFIDTAGIRTTLDKIENMGIERTFQKMRQAQIVMLLIDANCPIDMLNESIAKVNETIDRGHQKLIVCLNKVDLCKDANAIAEQLVGMGADDKLMFISAKEQTNTDELTTELLKVVNMDTLNEQDVIVTNARHFEALNSALGSITRVNDGLVNMIPTDFLAQDIRECLHFLGEITGDISSDEVLGNIFKNFCIGK